MFRISKDSPAYYLTSVANGRLPIFKTAKLKNIECKANYIHQNPVRAGLVEEQKIIAGRAFDAGSGNL